MKDVRRRDAYIKKLKEQIQEHKDTIRDKNKLIKDLELKMIRKI